MTSAHRTKTALLGLTLAVMVQAAAAAEPPPSLADRQIHTAQALIQRAATDPRGYRSLAAAYMKKARESGDFGFNAKAETALDRAAALAPDDGDTRKLRAALLLTYHRFAAALAVASAIQQRSPGDQEVYGYLTDAQVELGQYDDAIRSAQRMLDLRPDAAAYARASYLRALHGDSAGAIAAMRLAVDAADPRDPEGLAWCRVHLGTELLNFGQRDAAEHEFDRALDVFPDYHLALAGKARARRAAGDRAAAVAWYERAQARVPAPDTVIALGDLYAVLGRTADAARQYELAEFIERAGSAEAATYSRQLALFWADRDAHLDEALAIARREAATRQDIYTWDTLAWCLFKKGELVEAGAASARALRLGTRDARLHYHAGMIARAAGDRAAAQRHLELALTLDPSFDALQADTARRASAELALAGGGR